MVYVYNKQAKMPNRCKGRWKYRNLSVVLENDDIESGDIRHKKEAQNHTITLEYTNKVYLGKTMRSEGYKILREYAEMCDALNSQFYHI